MKERIVCEKIKRPFGMHPDYGIDILENSLIYERKVEQVPETFEELKELVNKYSGKINRQVGGITVGTTRIMIMMKLDNIYFGKNGNIYFADKYLGKYTPSRQWQIIKSLIGEE